jgi:6-phosphogluconolactonase (cycloisomerase 2 family)
MQKLNCIVFLIGSAILASATTPVVTITSPGSGASVGSPVNYVASASSPSCSKGISALRIYTATGVNAYTINSNRLNTNINLPVGSYNTTVQAWDNCGGVGKATVNITVSKINLAPPKFLYATEYKAGKIAEYVVNPLTGSLNPTSQGSTWAHWGPVDIASDHWGNHLYVANEGSHDLNAYFINRSSGNLTQVPGSPFKLAGTGNRVTVHPSAHFVYAISTNSGGVSDINAFAVQSNGSLTPVPGSPFAGTGSPLEAALTIDPTGKYLYASATSNGHGAVAAFTIDQTNGALTPLPGSPFLTPTYPGCTSFCSISPTDLAVDPTGKYLYAAENIQDSVDGFKIDPTTGSLTNLPGSPYAEGRFDTGNTPNDAWRLSVDPSGKFIYVANDEGNDFSVFKLNETTGVLSFVASIGNVSNAYLQGLCVPYTVNIDPSGSFLYSLGITSSLCRPGTNAVIGYSMNQANGNLISVPGSPFANANVHTTTDSQERVLVTR